MFFMDEQTTVAALRNRVSNFRDERNWLKDNTPKNLAISIIVEAAELLGIFSGRPTHRSAKRSRNEWRRTKSLMSLRTS